MATTETTAAVAEAGQKTGMPQLDFSTFPNQIFWLVIMLVATYFLLSRVVLPRIEGVLAERKGTIGGDLAESEALKQKAVAAEAAFNAALVQARGEAGKIIAAAKAAIQRDLDAATARADAQIAVKAAESEGRIGEIKAGAMAAVAEVARDTASVLVTALGGQADAKAVAAAVAARVKG